MAEPIDVDAAFLSAYHLIEAIKDSCDRVPQGGGIRIKKQVGRLHAVITYLDKQSRTDDEDDMS